MAGFGGLVYAKEDCCAVASRLIDGSTTDIRRKESCGLEGATTASDGHAGQISCYANADRNEVIGRVQDTYAVDRDINAKGNI